MKRLGLIAAVVLTLLLLWRFRSSMGENGTLSPGSQRREDAPAVSISRPSALEARGTAALERSTLADRLNAPTHDIQADLSIVSEILDTFRTNFLTTGNPVGDNAEITAALTGRNKLRLSLIPRDHPAINKNGELCDRWGTAFFFHAESATKMTVRSAGPDKKMWSKDDVVFTP